MSDLDGWRKPQRVTQGNLFPRTRKEFLALAHVGEADLRRWHEAGWLSDACLSDDEAIHDPQFSEICFIRDVATSGLSPDDIDRLLLQLEKPYAYEPMRIAYSFKYSWVELPPQPSRDDIDSFMEERLDQWLNHEAFADDGQEVLDRVAFALARARVMRRERIARGFCESDDE